MLDQIFFYLYLEKKKHYLKKEVIYNPKEKGGFEVLDYNTLNDTFKIKWLVEFMKNRESHWNVFPNYIFNILGGIYFFVEM